jgi:hypothetical protein
MQLYLTNGTAFSDAADYPENPPFPAPTGFTWTEGTPPAGMPAYVVPTIATELMALFLSMTQSDRIAFAPARATIEAILQTDPVDSMGDAKAYLQSLAPPSDSPDIQTQMLACFPS